MNNKDWTGNNKATYVMMGATNHSEKERDVNDFYATPPRAIDDLFAQEDFSKVIWEPACGLGHLSDRMKELGKGVLTTDLIVRRNDIGELNFLQAQYSPHPACDIITNPPFKYAKEFVEKAISLVGEDHKVAMFLKLTVLIS